jgi:hypothetical protein
MKKELNIILKMLMLLVKALFMIGKSIIKIIYLIIKFIDNLMAKLFMKLPRLLKVGVVYSLIGLAILNFINVPSKSVSAKTETTEDVAITTENLPVETTEKPVVEEKVENTTCKFDNENACKIYDKAIKKGLTEKQSLLVVAISTHETGYWTSKAFTENHNFGGIMTSKGLKSYSTYEEGLDHFVSVLKNYYFDKGLTTIEQIGAKYCPVSAENDPKGLNVNWVPSVTSIYNSYTQK